MSGRTSQAKGRHGEIELTKILQNAGFPVKLGIAQSFGTEPDLSGLAGVHIEVKRRERLDLSAAMEQAVRDAAKFGGGMPTVFHRRNREEWRVTMRFDDWLKIYTAFYRANN